MLNYRTSNTELIFHPPAQSVPTFLQGSVWNVRAFINNWWRAKRAWQTETNWLLNNCYYLWQNDFIFPLQIFNLCCIALLRVFVAAKYYCNTRIQLQFLYSGWQIDAILYLYVAWLSAAAGIDTNVYIHITYIYVYMFGQKQVRCLCLLLKNHSYICLRVCVGVFLRIQRRFVHFLRHSRFCYACRHDCYVG